MTGNSHLQDKGAINLRPLVKKVKDESMTCRIEYAKPMPPQMATLPKYGVKKGPVTRSLTQVWHFTNGTPVYVNPSSRVRNFSKTCFKFGTHITFCNGLDKFVG